MQRLCPLLFTLLLQTVNPTMKAIADEPLVPAKVAGALRVATYNVSLNRPEAGQLGRDLRAGDAQAERIAAVIRAVQPDILLLNELDFESEHNNARAFADSYLATEQRDAFGNGSWPLIHDYSAEVNTGEQSGFDLDMDGKPGEPDDAWGYGRFPGQYGMALLSRFPLEREAVRTIRKLKWSALPGALRPQAPDTDKPFHDEATWQQLRLVSKSFWAIPVQTPDGTLHLLASHPTPPAFDGPEDRNGCRNHDEVKLIQHFIEGTEGLVDDDGQAIGLAAEERFVILGDLNSDPNDGGSRPAAIQALLNHPRISQAPAPTSTGAVTAAAEQGGRNRSHQSDHGADTADFNDRSVGNLRVDYALPSANCSVLASGVFWPDLQLVSPELRPAVKAALEASDHHLVWVDLKLKP